MRVIKNTLDASSTEKIEKATNSKIMSATSLGGGCVSKVMRITTDDGKEYVAKLDDKKENGLATEGFMYKYLIEKTKLPTCSVLYCDDELLLLEYITVGGNISRGVEESAAEYLAELHNISSEFYGFERDTLVGGLKQPNPYSENWVTFFRDYRLLYMAEEAHKSGSLPISVYKKVEKLANKIDQYIEEPDAPSLIHGDVWTGNILYKDNKIKAFIDPAIYFAHSEIEFTFATVWSTFGDTFFHRYNEIRPIKEGFFELRRHIYNLYPLLVHTKLFGTSYAMLVDATISQFVSD